MPNQKIQIESLAYQGAGVGRTDDGKTVFVQGTVPGDLVIANTLKETARYNICQIAQLIESSTNRIAANCQYADTCGGCAWQIISYPEQLVWKRSFVVDALTRIAGFVDAEDLVEKCIPSQKTWGYRNKLEFSVLSNTSRLQLGLHGKADSSVTVINKCLLLPDSLQDSPQKLSGALSYVLKDSKSDLLRVEVRTSTATKDTEVAIWMLPGAVNRKMVAKVISEALPTSSVVRVISSNKTKERKVKQVEVLGGNGYWQEKLDGRILKLSAPSFFQVNSNSAQLLIKKVLQLLENSQTDSLSHVLDLYCGAGTFTLPLAEQFLQVSAVESTGSSLRDLKRNLADNRLSAEVIGGDVARELPNLAKAQAAVIDPPRVGLSKEALGALVAAAPAVIIYLSCNPTTLARDLRFLVDNGYKLCSATPIDLFPQSYHVETIVLLCR